MATVRKATVEDARDIASRIREADRRECLDHFGIAPTLLLPYSVKQSETYVGVANDGTPEVLFGVSPVVGNKSFGMIWMVATKEIEQDRNKQFQFLRTATRVLDKLQRKYPILGNYMDARNDLHLKWCKWVGFQVIGLEEKWGWRGKPFYKIIRTRKD